MDEQTVRTTYPYKRKPTPEQKQALAFVLRSCRERYNVGLHERRAAWHTCGVGSTAGRQRAQLPAIKAVRPAYRAVHPAGLAGRAHAPGSGIPGVLSARQGWREAGLSPLARCQPLPPFHLQASRQRRHARPGRPGPRHARPDRGPLVWAPSRGHPRPSRAAASGRLVRRFLGCGRGDPATPLPATG